MNPKNNTIERLKVCKKPSTEEKLPGREFPFRNRIVEITSCVVWILGGHFLRLLGVKVDDTLLRFEVELTIDRVAVLVHQLERVRPVAVHVTVA